MMRTHAARGTAQANAEINMVPLIDIMLVLVIVLLVTAPLLTHGLRIDLPRASSTPNVVTPETVTLSLDAHGRLHWEQEALTWRELDTRLARLTRRAPSAPEVHIRADGALPYRKIVRLMSAVSGAGVVRIGFVTEPVREP